MILRLVITLIVIASVFASTIQRAYAGEPVTPPEAHASRAVGRFIQAPAVRLALASSDVDELKSEISRESRLNPKGAAVGMIQTMTVMLVLAGVDLTAEQIHANGGKHPTAKQMEDIALAVLNATANSPKLWTQLFMSSTFSVMNRPAIALGQMLMTPALRAKFAPILARSISSTIMFVGWEFGSQLWTEATLLLPDNEYPVAASFFGVDKGVASTIRAAGGSVTGMKAKVARDMLQNMILVLSRSSLRSELFYNFVRSDLLTGEFQTMLASFVTAGAIGAEIGSAFCPVAGTVVGGLSSVAGAVASTFLPQSWKDNITNGWQFSREKVLNYLLKKNEGDLAYALAPAQLAKAPGSIERLYAYRVQLRSRWMTIEWERMYLEARAHDPQLSCELVQHLTNMKAFYVSQLRFAQAVARIDTESMARADVKKLVTRDAVRAREMMDFLDALAGLAATDPSNDAIVNAIEASDKRGFDETNAVLSWIQSN